MDMLWRFLVGFGAGIGISAFVAFIFFLVAAVGNMAEAYAFAKGYGLETASYVGSTVMLVLAVGLIFGVVAII